MLSSDFHVLIPYFSGNLLHDVVSKLPSDLSNTNTHAHRQSHTTQVKEKYGNLDCGSCLHENEKSKASKVDFYIVHLKADGSYIFCGHIRLSG